MHGVCITYVRESKPLGTAGSLAEIAEMVKKPIVVTNGDLITDVNYGDILNFHTDNKADGTMGVRSYELKNPFGVVKTDGIDIIDFEEKPVIRSNVNAGIYVINKKSLKLLEKGEYCDMPTLFRKIKLTGGKAIAYPLHEDWMDIGRYQDLVNINKMDDKL
jgi:ADP-glucose pyrophosphorylase